MFKVKVIAVGKCKEKWLKAALFEYEERMRGRLTIEWCLALDDKALLQLSLKEKNLIALDL
ncbi:MAG: 23S rRNA (pseudouridine(1915)-N(3))-methyltransferase RlmH, partial [Chlamydiae bacterium]|nr:23S rRNA (pseudouridine(1915)-N(3))-methyltransferase RlmH [Chlamydiota bacterium]